MERIKQKMAQARRQREALQRQDAAAQGPAKDDSFTLLSAARRISLPAGNLANYTLGIMLIAAVLFFMWLGSGGKPDSAPLTGPGEERGDHSVPVTGLAALNSKADLLQDRVDRLIVRVDRLDASVTDLESRLTDAGAVTTSTPDTRRDVAATRLSETMHASGDDRTLAGYPAAAMEAEDAMTTSGAASSPAIAADKPVAENVSASLTGRINAAEPAATAADTRATTGPDVSTAAGPESSAGTPATMATRETPADEPVQAAAKPPASGAAPDAPWVINLVSSPNKANAERFAARAKSRNIKTEMQQVTVKGTQYWRVQITGFSTREEAKTYAGMAREKLGLKDVWITKR